LPSTVFLECIADLDKVLEALAHLQAFYVQMTRVEEIVDPPGEGGKKSNNGSLKLQQCDTFTRHVHLLRTVVVGLALRYFILVMREAKINASGVNVDGASSH
jgi:hypothetical protein